MFWIMVLLVFLALCTALALIVRSRGGGSGEGNGIDNHDALQKGLLESYTRGRGQGGGPYGGGPSI